MNTSRDILLADIADERGTPCFVYFMDEATARIEQVRRLFGGRFHVSFAMKSNPNAGILSRMRQHCDFLDISSGGELRRALEAGWETQRISFTGPGKRPEELEAAVRHGVGEVVVESVAEASTLHQYAASAGRRQPVLVRIAPQRVPPGFGVNMAGKPTQFGIDEEDVDAALEQISGMPWLEVQGLHIYSGTQCLDASSLLENYRIFADIFRRVCQEHDLTPRKLIFGSGIGIPYHANNQPVALDTIAPDVVALLDGLRAEGRLAEATCVLETGRFLVGEAGVYLTRVLSRKVSRGSVICICDGGMNHHLAACGHLGGVLQRNYPIFRVEKSDASHPEETVDLVGPMCTSIDTLGQRVTLPTLAVGDVLGIECSGAYGLSASPVLFISHELPAEYIVEKVGSDDRITDVSCPMRGLESDR